MVIYCIYLSVIVGLKLMGITTWNGLILTEQSVVPLIS